MPGNQGPGGQGPTVDDPDLDEEARQYRDRFNDLIKDDKHSRHDAARLLKREEDEKADKASRTAAGQQGPTEGQSSEQRQQDRQAAEGRLPINNANHSFGYERADLQGHMEAANRHQKAREAAARDEGRRPSPEAAQTQPEAVRDEGRKTSAEVEDGRDDQPQSKEGAAREMTDRAQRRQSRDYSELIKEHQNQEHAANTGRGTDQSRG
jgi:hypothetical protein